MKRYVCIAALAFVIACARPVIDTGARPEGVGGTIAGAVTASDATTPVVGRKVTAINQADNARFEAITGPNGAYTLRVPAGTYQLEVELREGETLGARPDPTDVGVGDIDSARNFTITRQ